MTARDNISLLGFHEPLISRTIGIVLTIARRCVIDYPQVSAVRHTYCSVKELRVKHTAEFRPTCLGQ